MSKNKNQGFEISDGYNLLMLRAEEGNYNEVQNLLSGLRPIDTNAINKKGYTALAIAVKNGYTEIVRLLLSKGANVNVKNNSGQTPLFLSCWCNHVDLVRLLLESGADINTTDQRGWSPLTIAAYHGNTEIVQILLQNNVDVTIQDSFGKRAVHRAKDNRIIKMLQAAEIQSGISTCPTPEKSARGSAMKIDSAQTVSAVSSKTFVNGSITESSPRPKRIISPNHSIGGSPTDKNLSEIGKKTPTWQSDSKAKKSNASFDINASRVRSPIRRVTNPTDAKALLDKLVNPPKQTLKKARSPDVVRSVTMDQNNTTTNIDRRDLEDAMNTQLKNASEQIQIIIEQKVAVEINRNIIEYQDKLKKGLEVAINKKLLSSFQALQASFNDQLRDMLSKIGFNTNQPEFVQLLSDESFVAKEIVQRTESLKPQPIKEVRTVELNIQKMEKSLTNTRGVSMTPPPKTKAGREQEQKTTPRRNNSNTGHPVNGHRSDGKNQALENVNRGVKSATGTLIGYSNGKINEAVLSGTKALHDNLLAELGGNIDIAEDELRKKFEGLLANKFAQLSEIMASSSIHSEDVVEKTVTEDSYQDRKSSAESKSILQQTMKALRESEISKESGFDTSQLSLASEVIKASNNFKVDKIRIPENTRFQNFREKSEITRESLHSVEEEEDSGKEPLTGQDRFDSVKIPSEEQKTTPNDLSSHIQDDSQIQPKQPIRLEMRTEDASLTNITPSQSEANGPVSTEYRLDGLKNFYGRKSAADSDGRLSKNSLSNRGPASKSVMSHSVSHNVTPQPNPLIPSHNLGLPGPKIGVVQYDFENDD